MAPTKNLYVNVRNLFAVFCSNILLSTRLSVIHVLLNPHFSWINIDISNVTSRMWRNTKKTRPSLSWKVTTFLFFIVAPTKARLSFLVILLKLMNALVFFIHFLFSNWQALKKKLEKHWIVATPEQSLKNLSSLQILLKIPRIYNSQRWVNKYQIFVFLD